MTPAALLSALAQHGVTVALLDDGALRLTGPKAPPADLLAALRAGKPAVVATLATRPPAAPCPTCNARWWAGERGTWWCVACAHAAPGWTFRDPDETDMEL